VRRGFFAAALALVAALAAQAQSPAFTPFHASGIYDSGERAGWTATLAPGAGEAATRYTYAIRRNNRDTIQTGTLDLASGRGTIEITADEPEMLYVEVVPVQAVAKPAAIHLGAAIAPWKLRPSAPRPADFDSFWDAKLKALSGVPVNPVLTPAPGAPAGVELYTVRLDSLGSHVQGYLAKPAREGKFPALVLFQYAGVYALRPKTVTDRAAEGWLAFDVDSHDMPPDQSEGVARNYPAIGYTDRETSYFLAMYLRDTRAIDYIASRPDWDGRTIVISGTSMGGQQSLVTAGLNHKVTAVIVNEPAGADLNGDLHGRKAGYPYYPPDNAKVMETALYFDPVNFAPRIEAPVLAGIGFIDTTAPPAGIFTALNRIPGPKEVVGMVESDHNNRTPEKQGAWVARSKEVMDLILHGGEYKPDQGWMKGQ
jgi:cephalosporin-C deacetylase-like acetyl esterase